MYDQIKAFEAWLQDHSITWNKVQAYVVWQQVADLRTWTDEEVYGWLMVGGCAVDKNGLLDLVEGMQPDDLEDFKDRVLNFVVSSK